MENSALFRAWALVLCYLTSPLALQAADKTTLSDVKQASAKVNAVTIQTSLNIQVIDDDAERQQLIKEAESRGGYFLVNATHELKIRMPSDQLQAFLKALRAHWRVYSQSYQTLDVADELIKSRTAIKVKSELLARYQDMIANASRQQFTKVSSAAIELVEQIELLKGRVRSLQQQVDFALVTLQLAAPQMPQAKQASSFSWINQLGVPEMYNSSNYFSTAGYW